MIKRYYLLLSLVVSVIIASNEQVFAQDPQFTQFYANPIYLNPAFAGTGNCPRVALNYRNEWPGIPKTEGGTFNTQSASYDQHINAISGGLGFLVTNDRSGQSTLTTTNVSAIYSYQLSITRKFSLKAGLQGTYLQKSVDWSKLTFGDMIDARRGFIYTTNEIPTGNSVKTVDFSAGILGYSQYYYGGFAVHHLTEPNEALVGPNSPLPRKYTGHFGAVIPIGGRSNETNVSPNFLYQKQGDFEQYNFGIYANKGPIVAGVWYRMKDSFILLLGVQQKKFKFGYSYDITSSRLPNFGTKASPGTFGSHEVSFGLQFSCKKKKRKFRTVACPSF